MIRFIVELCRYLDRSTFWNTWYYDTIQLSTWKAIYKSAHFTYASNPDIFKGVSFTHISRKRISGYTTISMCV